MRAKLLPLAAGLLLAAAAHAVPVEKWVQSSVADFERGHAKGVSILSMGQLALAPELKPILQEAVPHVWALAVAPDGAVYAATGTEAKLLRLRGEKADTFFTSPDKSDIEVLAVAVAPDGSVFAATAPSGTLYRIGPDGKAEVFYKGADPYIWSLAAAPDGSVYAATGPNGKLLRITSKGKATTLLTANAKHVLSLALAADGSLYAGTDKQGLLYQISPKGEARLVYDAEEADIRALCFGPQGTLYFATAATRSTSATTPAMPSQPSSMIITHGSSGPGDAEPGPATSTLPSPRARVADQGAPGARVAATNAIYRLAPNGDVVKVTSISSVAFYALLWHNNRLYAGTGNDGRLYCVEGTSMTLLANLEESQITAFAVSGGRLLVATANSGRVLQVAADHAASGTFLSDVFDTAALSRWGNVSWEGSTPRGTAITVATRTGNSAQPDETWSAWSAEHSRPQGEQLTNPPARFVQFRLTLTTSKPSLTPVLTTVVVAYAQTNRKPVVSQVQLAKPPKPRRQPIMMPQPGQLTLSMPPPSSAPLTLTPPTMTTTTPGKQAASPHGPFPDLVRVGWLASDPNKDDLVYSLYFRGEDETTWKKLEERINTTFHDWDTHAVPDGYYRIRVVASDSPTNPPDQALEGERITEAFFVDNTPPSVANLAVRVAKDATVTITGQCSDAGSGLAEGEYSIDGGDWVRFVPADGVFDSAAESFEFKTKALAKGEHTIVVRVRDDAENSGAAKSVFKID